MNSEELIKKITEKKEYSELPEKDVEFVLNKFDKKNLSDEEKVKLSRKFLMENYSGFGSRKLLTERKRKPEWILKKHLSTRERFSDYGRIYKRILKNIDEKEISVIDLGSGVNGFSYPFFEELGFKVKYVGVEAIGQLVKKTNRYFKEKNYSGKALHFSLLDLEKIRKIVEETKKPRVVFMFKVIDSLESLKRNYSKKLLLEMVPLVERVVVSFPTKSMVKREKIWAKRTWFLKFVKKHFRVLDDFEIKDERYIVFQKFDD